MKKIFLFILFFGFVVVQGNSEPVAIFVTNHQSQVEKTATTQFGRACLPQNASAWNTFK